MDEQKINNYLDNRINQYTEESTRDDGTFDKEWFKSNIKSDILKLLKGEA